MGKKTCVFETTLFHFKLSIRRVLDIKRKLRESIGKISNVEINENSMETTCNVKFCEIFNLKNMYK